MFFIFFFFSSRRRHTRSLRDWSSDVCSSDLLREKPPDVLFLDIQMPARDGFDVIEQIGPANMPVIVFVTAHNHYALKAFEVHALDYLTKPIEPERLREALVHVKERVASKT